MGIPISKIGLSSRAYNVLRKMGVYTTEELITVSIDTLRRQRNVGAKTISEIEETLRFYNALNNSDDEAEVSSASRKDIRNQSIDCIGLSNRARNCLHRNGVHDVRSLLNTSIEKIGQFRNIGVKTQKEIEQIILRIQLQIDENPIDDGLIDDGSINDNSSENMDLNIPSDHKYSQNELDYLAQFSIAELGLSVRANNCLRNERLDTLDKIVPLSQDDYRHINNLGKKTAAEIVDKCQSWITEHPIPNDMDIEFQDENEYELYKHISDLLFPVFPVLPQKLARLCRDESIDIEPFEEDVKGLVSLLLGNGEFIKCFTSYVCSLTEDGLIKESQLVKKLDDECNFDSRILIDAIDDGKTDLCKCKGYYALKKITVLEYLDNYEADERAKKIIMQKLSGTETLQEVADNFDITRERVRQIVLKFIRSIPDCFEDYYAKPFCYFNFSSRDFISIFELSGLSEINYLSVKYKHGALELTSDSAQKYVGPFNETILEYIRNKETKEARSRISKTDLVYRVLIESDTPLSIEEFQAEYDNYLYNNGCEFSKYSINIRTVINQLRNAKKIVFNRDNKVRYIDINAKELIRQIDFDLYRNLIVSSELLYKNNVELMEDFDVQDGYELFYI